MMRERPDEPVMPDHDHVWGELRESRLAGTLHRRCLVDDCDIINAYDDDCDHDGMGRLIVNLGDGVRVVVCTCGVALDEALPDDGDDSAAREYAAACGDEPEWGNQ